jgi:hypothetical protein
MATVTQDAEAAALARRGYRVGARAARRPRIERGRRRITLTKAGHTRYPQPSGTPPRVALPVPDPQFLTQTPAGRRLSTPVPPCAPGGQSVPHHPYKESSVGQRRCA